jgi:uncharacterized membrane protein
MQKRFASVIAIGRKIGLNDDNGYVVAIFLGLLIVSATVIGYYVILAPPAESYNTIYLLDSNNKAMDYPKVLVADQNSTFNVYVNVENHMTKSADYTVEMKIVENLPAIFPIDMQPTQVYETGSLSNNGKPWQTSATVTENTIGSYSVVFELWQHKDDGSLLFTQNLCVLKIQVVN